MWRCTRFVIARSGFDSHRRLQMNIHRKPYTQRRVRRALDYLGGKCECGETTNLHFHHIEPKTKVLDISTAIRTECWSWEKLEIELNKCILLCEACHRMHHASSAEHGTPQRYWRGCRCLDCKAANSIHAREYRKSKRIN